MNPIPPAAETGRAPNGEKHLLNLLKLAETHWQKAPQLALHYAEQALILSVKFRKDKSEYQLHGILGRILCLQGDFFNSFIHLNEAQQKCKAFGNDAPFMADLSIGFGDYYLLQNDLEKALNYYYDGLNWDRENTEGLFHLKLANLFCEANKNKKALFHQKLASKILKDSSEYDLVAESRLILGKIILADGHGEEAHACFLTALELLMEPNSSAKLKCECLSLIGSAFMEMGDFDKAYSYFRKATKISKQSDLRYYTALQNIKIGDAIFSKGHLNESILHLEKTLEMVRNNSLTTLEVNILEKQMDIFERSGKIEKAFLCAKEIADLKSQLTAEKTDRILSTIQSSRAVNQSMDSSPFNFQRSSESPQEQSSSIQIDLEQYAYIVAHDMKEPLRNICSFAELLSARYSDQLDDNANDYLGFIQQNSKHFYALLTDLLDYASTNKNEDDVSEINLNAVISHLDYIFRDQLDEFKFDLKRMDLPMISAVPEHFTLLFQHLIQNAIRFRSSDAGNIISIACKQEEDNWILSVADNGIGIDTEHQEKIFKIFNRLDRQSDGTGIGLSLCRKILDMYGGKIWVESKKGKGSCFYVSLPGSLVMSNNDFGVELDEQPKGTVKNVI